MTGEVTSWSFLPRFPERAYLPTQRTGLPPRISSNTARERIISTTRADHAKASRESDHHYHRDHDEPENASTSIPTLTPHRYAIQRPSPRSAVSSRPMLVANTDTAYPSTRLIHFPYQYPTDSCTHPVSPTSLPQNAYIRSTAKLEIP